MFRVPFQPVMLGSLSKLMKLSDKKKNIQWNTQWSVFIHMECVSIQW